MAESRSSPNSLNWCRRCRTFRGMVTLAAWARGSAGLPPFPPSPAHNAKREGSVLAGPSHLETPPLENDLSERTALERLP